MTPPCRAAHARIRSLISRSSGVSGSRCLPMAAGCPSSRRAVAGCPQSQPSRRSCPQPHRLVGARRGPTVHDSRVRSTTPRRGAAGIQPWQPEYLLRRAGQSTSTCSRPGTALARPRGTVPRASPARWLRRLETTCLRSLRLNLPTARRSRNSWPRHPNICSDARTVDFNADTSTGAAVDTQYAPETTCRGTARALHPHRVARHEFLATAPDYLLRRTERSTSVRFRSWKLGEERGFGIEPTGRRGTVRPAAAP